MRHLKSGRRLGVNTAHRKAMMRNLVTSLLEHEQIYCTLARAKEMRKPLDKMITLGKAGDLHARRQALKFIKSKAAMANLFGEFATRYQNRNGGYSRIIRLGKRRLGDGAEMVIIQLIDGSYDLFSKANKPSASSETSEKDDTLLESVSQEIQDVATTAEEGTPVATEKIEDKKATDEISPQNSHLEKVDSVEKNDETVDSSTEETLTEEVKKEESSEEKKE